MVETITSRIAQGAADRPTCLDGGAVHSWRSAGLDVMPVRGRDELRRVRVCVWCERQRSLPF